MKIDPKHAEQAVKNVAAAADTSEILALLEGIEMLATHGNAQQRSSAIQLYAACYIEVGKLQAATINTPDVLCNLVVRTVEGIWDEVPFYMRDNTNVAEIATTTATIHTVITRVDAYIPGVGPIRIKMPTQDLFPGGQIVIAKGELKLRVSHV